jgi:DNA primase
VAENFAQTVKQQVDIVKIIGDYVKLRKTGAQNYSGLCPFHKEKTGSFSVNATHGYFYCFGCHEKGDVFTFVMKMDVVSFPEAVRAVAQKAGIPLPKREFSSPEEAAEAGIRRQLIDLHEAATQYFEAQLKSPGAARAREYMTGRGITPETVQKFRLGFAPDDFNDMRDRLKPHFSDEALRASGLFTSSEKSDDGAPTGQLYARFRKRITFPIASEQGKTIAFTARALEAVDDKGRPVAKYLNSPETLLYTKGNVLFNLDKAKSDMRSLDFALLVEGQMDCISVFMAGVKNVLATSGTAFTEAQVRLLSRFTKNVIVNFDEDIAGSTAASKSVRMLTEEGFVVKVVSLDDGLDPDQYVKSKGIQAYMTALRQAKRLEDYLIERVRHTFPGRTPEAKVKSMNFLLPYIGALPSAIQRDDFVANAAQKLAIDSAILWQEVRLAAAHKLHSVKAHRDDDPDLRVAFHCLTHALASPEIEPARPIAANALLEHPEWYQEFFVASLFEALIHGDPSAIPVDRVTDEQSRRYLAATLASTTDTSKQSLAEQTEVSLQILELRELKRKAREAKAEIGEAERRGDIEAANRLGLEQHRIMQEIRKRERS